MKLKKAMFLLGFSFVALTIWAETPFVVIMYDANCEQLMEPFPIHRAQYAKAINELKKDNAKAVVLKFFFDQAKDQSDDTLMAESFKLLPVFLQACIDNTEANPNQLDDRFYIDENIQYKKVLSGNSGWIPLPLFAKNAYSIGFVDIRNAKYIPILEG